MDFLKDAASKYAGGQGQQGQQGQQQTSQSTSSQGQGQQSSSSGSGGFLGGITDKFNTAAGGGKESEKNEDMLDK